MPDAAEYSASAAWAATVAERVRVVLLFKCVSAVWLRLNLLPGAVSFRPSVHVSGCDQVATVLQPLAYVVRTTSE